METKAIRKLSEILRVHSSLSISLFTTQNQPNASFPAHKYRFFSFPPFCYDQCLKDTSRILHGQESRVWRQWSVVPKQSQSVPHVVGAISWPDLHVPHVFSSCSWTHVYLIVTCLTSIYSVDTLLYPYTLPLQFISYTFSSLCLSATWALA